MNNQPAKIRRVPSLLLEDERNKEDYVPKVVSIGPYHHGKEELRLVESFKPEALNLFVSGEIEEISFYLEKILESISEVRKCYDEEPTNKYTDHVLAWMMLLDACLILNRIIIEVFYRGGENDPWNSGPMFKKMHEHLGFLTMALLPRDFFLLDNQIPFRIIKLLIEHRREKNQGEEFLERYLNETIFGEDKPKRGTAFTSSGNENGPLHLLEAFHLLIIFDCNEHEKTDDVPDPRTDVETGTDPATGQSSCTSRVLSSMHKIKAYTISTIKEDKKVDDKKKYYHSFRSVTDLKAKGIHFKPSPTASLMDVRFTSNFLYAQLQLPVSFVSIYTKVIFLNIIAYELSPNNDTNGEVTVYISLMKSLIERPEDVKELREKRISLTELGSDEEVFNVYKEINTYGGASREIFQEVKNNIQSHCNSKGKTWIAELILTHFRNPWTVLTFLAACILLFLSSIQTYFTVYPKSDK